MWQFSAISNIYFSYDPAFPLIHIYPRFIKMDGHTNTFIEMLTAALFKIAPNCEKTE